MTVIRLIIQQLARSDFQYLPVPHAGLLHVCTA